MTAAFGSPCGLSEHSPRILIVDDNPKDLELISEGLCAQGYNVLTAYGGEQAYERAREEQPDLIVLDLLMPGQDGLAVAQGLKSDSACASIPIIVMTAKVLSVAERKQLEKVAVAVAEKNISQQGAFFTQVQRVLEKSGGQAPPAKKRLILLVEDNPLNRQLLDDILTAQGYETLQGATGVDAIKLARQHRPDLIFMDIQMPEIDGLEAARTLKDDPDTGHIPIVALTALAMPGDKEDILAAGCDDYLAKPVIMDQVVAMVAKWLRRERGQA